MSKVAAALVLLFAFSSVCLASSPRVEVLYLEGYDSYSAKQGLLYTYNINPHTATAELAASALQVPLTSITPLTIGTKHFIYLSNATDVWKYDTNAQGVPDSQASQHLSFGLPYPVDFVVDPDGKFAYACMTWWNSTYGNYAAIVLFTIDPASGDLSNTGDIVATYGPSYYVPITQFLFGTSGRRLYFFENYSFAPFSCGGDYHFHNVNQSTGDFGPSINLVGWGDCGYPETGTITDSLTAVAQTPFGRGSGTIVISQTFTHQTITCGASMLAFCGDNVWTLSFDPASKNIFFGDHDTGQMSIGHIDFETLQLLSTRSAIATAQLFFSPDSKLVYAVRDDIAVYAFDPSNGDVGASSLIPRPAFAFNVATTTLGGK